MKKIYIKIFLVLFISFTIFTLVGAMSVAATEPNEEVEDEASDLATAVIPSGSGGYQNQYCGDNGEGYTHTHQNNGDYDHNQYNWQWECKK